MADNHSKHDEVIEPLESKMKWHQSPDFWIGFICWFVVNLVLFGLLSSLDLVVPFAINIIGIIILFTYSPRIALGILSAFGCLSLSGFPCCALDHRSQSAS